MAPFFERGAKTVETFLPKPAVAGEPRVKGAERLRPQRIETALAVRPHRDEACFMEDAQVARDARLMDARAADERADFRLAAAQRVDDAAAGRVAESLKSIYMHDCVYVRKCI